MDDTPLRRTARILIATSGLPLLATGCATVEFYEKSAFADPTREFAETPAQLHWIQKVQYSD